MGNGKVKYRKNNVERAPYGAFFDIYLSCFNFSDERIKKEAVIFTFNQ